MLPTEGPQLSRILSRSGILIDASVSYFLSLTSLKMPNRLSCRHSSLSASDNQKGPLSELRNTRDWVSTGSKVQGKLPRYPCSCSMSVACICVALPPNVRFIL
jgi:hypothetical protein